jgi:hypothetical protein
MHDNPEYLFEAIRVGASGYVLKTAVDRDLVEACRAAMRGEPLLHPGAIRTLMREYLDRARAGEASTERDVLTSARRQECRATRDGAGPASSSSPTSKAIVTMSAAPSTASSTTPPPHSVPPHRVAPAGDLRSP